MFVAPITRLSGRANAVLGTLCLFALGCSDAPRVSPDAGPLSCAADSDCDDGVFCNGVETCAPAAINASARGCVPSPVGPCANDDVCDERLRSCIADCPVTPDADGDGAIAIACGGTDCDDSDASRYPGNVEVCDDDDVDEDCDANTFGFRDQDGDGWPDATCCNGDQCGSDCNDMVAVIHPTSPELCDGLDNDCNGETDDNVAFGELPIWYRDGDGDGYGLQSAQRAECTNALAGYSRFGGDCNDNDAMSNPDGVEDCDGLDNDCDPATHACWIHTQTGSRVFTDPVGQAGDESFERSCAGFGTGVAEWRFRVDNGSRITNIGVTCGAYVAQNSPNVSAEVRTDGVATPPGIMDPPGSLYTDIYLQTAGAPASRTEYFPCDAVDPTKPTITGFTFFPHRDDEFGPAFSLELGSATCSETFIETESLSFEVGESEQTAPAFSDPEQYPEVRCPAGHAPIGIHGTFTTEPDEGRHVTSVGLICVPLFGVETLE